MDNQSRSTRVSFGPARWLVGVTALAGVLLIGLVAGTDDRAGRLLYTLAALVAFGTATRGLLISPRLIVARGGLDVRTGWSTRHLDWSQITRIRLDARRRLGLASSVLEVDAGEHLFVLTRWDLGTDPQSVAEIIQATRPA